MQDVHAQLDVFYTAYTANRAAAASALLPVVENLPDNTAYEANEKAVDRIFLQLLAAPGSSLNPAQQQALETIAAQCPFWGGDAVYAARGMLTIHTGIQYDDAPDCAGSERTQTMGNPAQADGLSLWPNPATDHITLNAERVFKQATVLNYFGQPVYDQCFEPVLQMDLQLPALGSGTYFLRISYSDGSVAVRKIVVLR